MEFDVDSNQYVESESEEDFLSFDEEDEQFNNEALRLENSDVRRCRKVISEMPRKTRKKLIKMFRVSEDKKSVSCRDPEAALLLCGGDKEVLALFRGLWELDRQKLDLYRPLGGLSRIEIGKDVGPVEPAWFDGSEIGQLLIGTILSLVLSFLAERFGCEWTLPDDWSSEDGAADPVADQLYRGCPGAAGYQANLKALAKAKLYLWVGKHVTADFAWRRVLYGASSGRGGLFAIACSVMRTNVADFKPYLTWPAVTQQLFDEVERSIVAGDVLHNFSSHCEKMPDHTFSQFRLRGGYVCGEEFLIHPWSGAAPFVPGSKQREIEEGETAPKLVTRESSESVWHQFDVVSKRVARLRGTVWGWRAVLQSPTLPLGSGDVIRELLAEWCDTVESLEGQYCQEQGVHREVVHHALSNIIAGFDCFCLGAVPWGWQSSTTREVRRSRVMYSVLLPSEVTLKTKDPSFYRELSKALLTKVSQKIGLGCWGTAIKRDGRVPRYWMRDGLELGGGPAGPGHV